jgi:hypothetical protein
MEEHDDPILYFMHMANYVIDSPLRTPEQVKDFVGPMYKQIPRLRAAMKAHAADIERITALTEKMIELRDCLFSSMCDNYIEMSKREALSLSHPGSSAIILFIYCATITIMAKDEIDLISGAHYDIVTKLGLCIFAGDDPKHDPRLYTAQNVLDLVWLMSNRWPLLRVTSRDHVDAIFKYVQQLVHRAMWLVGQPHPPAVLNCKAVSKIATRRENEAGASVDDNSPPLVKANIDLIRRYVDGLCRMMGHIRAFFALQWKIPSFPPHINFAELTQLLKQHICKNIEALSKLPSLRQEIRMMYDRLSTRHCDFAIFIEKCNGEPFEPTSMMMMTKPPEYQTAAMQYCNCVDLIELAKSVNEGDHQYAKKVDILTHLHSQNIKFHAIEGDLREFDIKLRVDYVLSEVDFLTHISNTIKETFPSFISFMGRYHVIMGRDVYICDQGVEQALCVWARIIMRDLKGQLSGINIVGGIEKMFGGNRVLVQSLALDAPPAAVAASPHTTGHVQVPAAAWGDESFI